MRKRVAIAAVAVIALLAAPLALGMPVDGFTGPTVSIKGYCPPGKQIAYVTQNVLHSADFGQTGIPWAIDNYHRIIQLFQTGPTTFCATTSYIQGTFTTTGGGPSPGGTDADLSPGISGTMGGADRTTVFSGQLRPIPLEPTSGTFDTDYGCLSSGYCPGYVDWTSFYFSSVQGLVANWWVWAYLTPANGTWVQRADFTYGDITG
jgi:hypothetical protein